MGDAFGIEWLRDLVDGIRSSVFRMRKSEWLEVCWHDLGEVNFWFRFGEEFPQKIKAIKHPISLELNIYISDWVSSGSELSLDDSLTMWTYIFVPNIGRSHFAIELLASLLRGIRPRPPIPTALRAIRHKYTLRPAAVDCYDKVGTGGSTRANSPIATYFFIDCICASLVGDIIEVEDDQSVRADFRGRRE